MTSEHPGPAASHRVGLCWLRWVSFDLRLRGPRSNWFGTAPAFSHRRGRDIPDGSNFINANSLTWFDNFVWRLRRLW